MLALADASERALSLSNRSPAALSVIVANLVRNAIQHAQCHRITVRIEPDRLCVEDDGCGMPSDGAIKGTGIGTKLISAMAKSLRTAVEIDAARRGVKATLRGAVN